MRLLVSLTLLLAVRTCHSHWINPDDWERMLQHFSATLQIPKVQNINDIKYSPSQRDGGFRTSPYPSYTYQQPKNSDKIMAPTSSGTSSTNPFDTFLRQRWRDHVINILSRGVTKLALDIDRTIEKLQPSIPDSTLFSPVSLTTTLAMMMLASGGKTFEEVTRILGLESGIDISHHSEVVHQVFGLLLNQAGRISREHPEWPQSKFAFGIFVEDGFPIRNEFRDVSEKVYNSEVISVDFSHRSSEAQRKINDWVYNRTEGKIKNMLMDPPSPATDVIITSALYFRGEWEKHFMKGGTEKKAFIVNDNETIYADMMVNGGDFSFYADEKLGASIIAFPYKGKKISMYALLPNEKGTDAVKNLKSKLNPEVIDDLIGNMKTEPCIIAYPKMNLSSTLRLQSALKALGLKSLFDPQTADLSVLTPGRKGKVAPPTAAAPLEKSRKKRQTRPIDREFIEFLNNQKLPTFGVDDLRNTAGLSNPGLYADDVIHKVEVTVNEEGTEAAAASAVVLGRSGRNKRFVANRPFLFFIRNDAAKSMLFWATINRPSPYYTSL